MVILAYRFRLESADPFPDDGCPAHVAWAGPASTQIVSDEARRLDLHVAHPNWQSQLPGAKHRGVNPDGFMTRAEIVAYFEDYV